MNVLQKLNKIKSQITNTKVLEIIELVLFSHSKNPNDKLLNDLLVDLYFLKANNVIQFEINN